MANLCNTPENFGRVFGKAASCGPLRRAYFSFCRRNRDRAARIDGARLKIVRAQYTWTQSKKPSSTCQNPIPFLAQSSEDFLTNCRSALDYSIWEIAGFFAKRELIGSPRGGDRIHFPICAKPCQFSDWKKEAGLSDWGA